MSNIREVFEVICEYPVVSIFLLISIISCLQVVANIRLVTINNYHSKDKEGK